MPKLRAAITMDYDARDMMEAANWTHQIQRLGQQLRQEGWPNVEVEVKERRDRATKGQGGGSAAPSFRRTVPPS